MEGLKFGGAHLRREICVSKSIGLALQLELNLPFLLCFSLYLRAIFQVQAPRGLYLEGRFNGGFSALPVKGAYIWRGFYMEGLIFGILRYLFSNRSYHDFRETDPRHAKHVNWLYLWGGDIHFLKIVRG